MNYLNIGEFAELVYIAPNTLYKRFKLGSMPKPESTMNGEGRGRPYKVWKESTVNKFKEELINKLQGLLDQDYSLKQASEICEIGLVQARKLIYKPAKVSESSYDLFFNTLNKIG